MAVCKPVTMPGMTGHARRNTQQLRRELRHKEKALAEAAALLVLRKKLNALWDNDSNEDE